MFVDMQIADVWSCGVMLYIMLAAAYPFGRPEDENLKPSRKMHVMLQVSDCALIAAETTRLLQALHLARQDFHAAAFAS